MQPVVWAVTIPFAIIYLASCIIRLYSRHMIAKSFGPDDWLMFAGTFVWIAYFHPDLYQLSSTADTTYVFGSVTIVTSVEFAVAMITNNLPGVAAFCQSWRGRNKASQGGGDHSSGTHGRSFELGHLATIGGSGQQQQRSKAEGCRASSKEDEEEEESYRGTESEKELNPRHARDRRTLQRIMEGSGEVRVETNVVVSHGPVQSSFERSPDKAAGDYFKFD
ncbi:hypothetical protein LQW54_005560 [Pestalotiopsis sp. IQ-011]